MVVSVMRVPESIMKLMMMSMRIVEMMSMRRVDNNKAFSHHSL